MMNDTAAREALRMLSLGLLAGPLLALPAHAATCKFTAERTAHIDGSVQRVVIKAGAGDLTVRGSERSAVDATGRACASSESLLGRIQIETRREGDTVYVRTVLPEDVESSFFVTHYAWLDLTLSVPKSAALAIEDSSGDMDVSDARSASIVDSSGQLTVRNIAGDLDVRDSSGGIRIERVGGNLRLEDSSGDINIAKVAGRVHIVNDSSGDIGIQDVQRDVTIDADGSGSIRVHRVGGNFTVGTDGSGGIEYAQVQGTVRIPTRHAN